VEIVKEFLSGALLLKYSAFEDERGLTSVPFHGTEFSRCADRYFVISQTLLSKSSRNCLRGMHYQDSSAPVAKIVSCLSGKIQDVIVDLRQASPTFGQWACVELSFDDATQIYIPAGMAHGYLTLSDTSTVFYLQEGFYNSEASCILAWNDPDVNIKWLLNENTTPDMSDRDRNQGISLADYKHNPQF
jgi:dTDP-4-dehydrorhamnose 3,5-epimerase